jgi:hydroxybutyrate-dimer hydrolase
MPASVELEFGPARIVVDGERDDLLTAGLGTAGLWQAPSPLASELDFSERRRRAIVQNWRALADLRPGSHATSITAQRIAGVEYLAVAAARHGLPSSGMLLQIPAHFDVARPCLLVTAASGSRGVYGGLPTVGQWGLRRGCAVVTDDKGLGMGVVSRGAGWAVAPDGAIIGIEPTPPPFEHALELPHAHQQFDSEANWGRLLLRAGQFGLERLTQEFPQAKPFTAANTLIIAAGISNGGAAVLQSLEADDGAFFDGAVAAEPNVHVDGAPSLYEYASQHALLQPCAILAENLAEIPLGMLISMAQARHVEWCERLAADGLVTGEDSAARADDARQRLLASGIEASALRQGAINLQFGLWTSVTATYAQNYLRRGLADAACGIGYAATDASGTPRALSVGERAALFSDGTGIAPTAGINLVAKAADGSMRASAAASYETARCLSDLVAQTRSATAATRVAARPGKRPVIVLHGRADALIPIAHSSRAYVALAGSHNPLLRFVELVRGQHFDAFLAIPGMQALQPMQPTIDKALDDVWVYLRDEKPLPPSIVID